MGNGYFASQNDVFVPRDFLLVKRKGGERSLPSEFISKLSISSFAASHSRGTKTSFWDAKVALGQDKQTINIILNKNLITLFVLSQCDYCSPAWRFCTAWMASCNAKGIFVTTFATRGVEKMKLLSHVALAWLLARRLQGRGRYLQDLTAKHKRR